MTKGRTARPTHFVRGVICALLGASLWGFSGACAQLLLSTYEVPATSVTAIRMIGAGVIFLAVILVRKRAVLLEALRDRKTVLQLVFFGIFGLFLSQITYLTTIDYTNAGTATVLQCLGILFVVLFTCVRARRLPRLREASGFALAFGATFLIATQGNPLALSMPLPGLLWGLACGLAWAFYSMYPRRLLKRWGSLVVTGAGMFSGGIIANLFIQPWTAPIPLEAGSIIAFAALIILGTFAAFFLFMQGIADIGPVRTVLLGAIEPASATFFSWIWLGTQFTLFDCLGFVLMIAMVLLVTSEKPAPEATELPATPDSSS